MRHSVRARFLQTLVCAGCALTLPVSAAAAGGSPVHVDPSSPVAKEYALPLATARGAQPESGQSGKLFGSGIKHAATVTRTTPVQPAAPLTATTQTEQPVTTGGASPTTTATATTMATATATPRVRTHRPRRRRHHLHHGAARPPVLKHTTVARRTAHATPAAYRVLRPGSGSGLLWMALAALVVVALGSAGGLALRRRR
jgi:hypothetical protein